MTHPLPGQVIGHIRAEMKYPDDPVPDIASATLYRYYLAIREQADLKSQSKETRHTAAAAMYNDTMIDSDNVLLLKPVRVTSGLRGDSSGRPAMNAQDATGGIVLATVYAFGAPIVPPFIDFFETKIAPMLCAAGAVLLGYYITEPTENTFPQLPVRDSEHVFVWFASFADEEAYAAYQMVLTERSAWTISLLPALQGWLARPEEVLELAPTRRSLLRHRSA